jgi:hypothetical protein
MSISGPAPDRLTILHHQLVRMRSMDAMYHRRFFSDVRFITLLVLGLFVIAWTVNEALLLLIPFVALIGACQTAFDASYLIFARRYAAALERRINALAGTELLVGSRLEDAYLFSLDRNAGSGFTWFGFMTAFYTLLGIGAYAVGLIGGLEHLDDSVAPLYLVGLLGLTGFALVFGVWWFVTGRGDQRLTDILVPWTDGE